MILNGGYTRSDGGERAPCPFCGSIDTEWRAGGPYSYDKVYCNGCKTEFTFYPPAGEHRVGGPKCTETLNRWDSRANMGQGIGPERCPFCWCGKVEFEGVMNYSTLFVDAYCPDCRVRFEFQGVKRGKVERNNLNRARRAFRRRCGS